MQTSLPHVAPSIDACPKAPSLFLLRLFRDVLPEARGQIRRWTDRAEQIPDGMLRKQALASLAHKRFHADGGCVYAAAAPTKSKVLVTLIVALQTISDYLDNLCDRCDVLDEADFEQLHHAMRDAVRPDAALRPYYLRRGNPDDGGYLAELVRTCQSALGRLRGYPAVQPQVAWLVERYCELQQIKHIEPAHRAARLQQWSRPYRDAFPDVEWWEFAAATGSTLAMFALLTMAADDSERRPPATAICDAYFPYICGLHILLDYLIDLEEDAIGGDFNFVCCYPSPEEATRRLRVFAKRSLHSARALAPHSEIHSHVVHGLLAMYLSDGKARRHPAGRAARRLLLEFGPTAWMYYGACVLYRFVR